MRAISNLDLPNVYAALNHNHNGVYSLINHSHEGIYSPVNHNHNGTYALLSHDHDADYSPINHNHNDSYAPKTHTHSEYLTEHQDISGKADKVSNGVSGNFASLDSSGNIADSGKSATDFAGSDHNHDGAYAGASHSHSEYITDVSDKANKVTNATNGNLAGLNSNGDITDSGTKPSDFAGASHNHDSSYAAINHTHSGFMTATRVTNTTVAVADWVSDNTFLDFPYGATISISGVTSSDYANVFFAATEITEGIYAPYTMTDTGVVYIYAVSVPSAAITIPLIEVIKT